MLISVFLTLLLAQFPSEHGPRIDPERQRHPWAKSNWCGVALAPYGDWNDDGHDDFLVSTPRDSDEDDGWPEWSSVGVVSGTDGDLLLEILGERLEGNFVSAHDDIDGDGYREILIDARIHDGQTGKLRFELEPDAGERSLPRTWRTHVRPIPDMDGDRVGDLVFSRWIDPNAKTPADRQRIVLYSGKSGAPLRTLRASEDRRALTAIGISDANADGTSDVVAAFTSTWRDDSHDAELQTLSGKDGSLIATRSFGVAEPEPEMTLVPAGDVNHDGRPDVAFSLFYDSGELPLPGAEPGLRLSGNVWIACAADLQAVLDLTDSEATFRYGYALAGETDVNHDGCADVLVTEYADLFDEDADRQLRVLSGRDGALLRRHGERGAHFDAGGRTIGGFRYQESGRSVAWVGDIDADGTIDYATGGSNLDPTSSCRDGVTVFSGATGEVILALP